MHCSSWDPKKEVFKAHLQENRSRTTCTESIFFISLSLVTYSRFAGLPLLFSTFKRAFSSQTSVTKCLMTKANFRCRSAEDKESSQAEAGFQVSRQSSRTFQWFSHLPLYVLSFCRSTTTQLTVFPTQRKHRDIAIHTNFFTVVLLVTTANILTSGSPIVSASPVPAPQFFLDRRQRTSPARSKKTSHHLRCITWSSWGEGRKGRVARCADLALNYRLSVDSKSG